MKVDLHTHSTISDGRLTPAELLREAESRGIELFSITDHDSVDAYSKIGQLQHAGVRLIHGIEFSTAWQGIGIHIVGLNVDIDCQVLGNGIALQRKARMERAQRISDKLDKLGMENTWKRVQEIAGQSVIGRPHFAQYLVESGKVKNENEAFKRYLGPGKTGDIKCLWMSMEQTIHCITDSGGIAVLAHPSSYRLTNTRLARLLDDFASCGGVAMEVISGQQTREVTEKLARLCQLKDLYASSGSDFHRPGQAWSELGGQASLPVACKPVWELWP